MDNKNNPDQQEVLKKSQKSITELFEKVNPSKEKNPFLMIIKMILTVMLYGLLIALSPLIILVLFIVVIVAI